MLGKVVVFLIVFGLVVKVGSWLAIGYGGISAFQLAAGIQESNVAVKVFVFLLWFTIIAYLALYLVVVAAIALGVKAAASV